RVSSVSYSRCCFTSRSSFVSTSSAVISCPQYLQKLAFLLTSLPQLVQNISVPLLTNINLVSFQQKNKGPVYANNQDLFRRSKGFVFYYIIMFSNSSLPNSKKSHIKNPLFKKAD